MSEEGNGLGKLVGLSVIPIAEAAGKNPHSQVMTERLGESVLMGRLGGQWARWGCQLRLVEAERTAAGLGGSSFRQLMVCG